MPCYATNMVRNILRKRHYFDSGSFTPINKKALGVMKCVLEIQKGCCLTNPSSEHMPGRVAKKHLEHARTTLARHCQIKAGNIIFSSGATEANFLAIRLAILHAIRKGMNSSDVHIITGNEEHDSVYKEITYFKAFGIQHTNATPKNGRRFAPSDITKHIRKNTVALSLQMVNSRHGALQPIASIAKACRDANPSIFIHTDAAQATAYFNCSPTTLGVDAVTIDSTKSFGPQGVGALLFQKAQMFARDNKEDVRWGIRSGTPSVALIYGFSTAFNEAQKNKKKNYEATKEVRNSIVSKMKKIFPDAFIHGVEKQIKEVQPSDWENVAPHLLYVSFPGINHAYLATLLDTNGFATATNYACAEQEEAALRIGVLPTTTQRSVSALLRCLQKQMPVARNMT